MIRVFFQGTFEIVNAGHIKCFEMCRSKGDELIVGLNTNELVRSYKKREPIFPFEEKKLILESIKHITKVVPAPSFSPLSILKELDITVFCVADEWKKTKDEEIAYMLSKDIFNYDGPRIVYIPDFGLTRTSQVKERLLAEALGKL